jgi:hypothetical protein
VSRGGHAGQGDSGQSSPKRRGDEEVVTRPGTTVVLRSGGALVAEGGGSYTGKDRGGLGKEGRMMAHR